MHADARQGKTLDIILKKVKHRLVERMSATTADSLGMSRAILVNDSLVKRLQQLDDMEQSYRHLVDHTERVLRAFYGLTQCFKGIMNSNAYYSTYNLINVEYVAI